MRLILAAFIRTDSLFAGRLYRILLLVCIKLNYAMQRVVILNGPVAQPGRVPDFYHRKEIRLSRVRIPTGPHRFSFESTKFIAGFRSIKNNYVRKDCRQIYSSRRIHRYANFKCKIIQSASEFGVNMISIILQNVVQIQYTIFGYPPTL
jgi:hypothetical protein